MKSWFAPPESRFGAVGRWLLVVPAAIAAFGIVQVIVIVELTFSPLQGISPWLSDRAGQVINDALGPYCFVLAGSLVAPTRKRLAAVVLAFTFIAACAVVFALAASAGKGHWGLVVSLIVGIIASGLACIHACD